MIQIFKHRCNKISQLSSCKKHWGVEIDLRSNTHNPSDLHLSHNPWEQGESFRTWVEEYVQCGLQGPIILNTKEDGLETLAIEILKQNNLHSYVFLDTTLPTLKKWTRDKTLKNFFIRWSHLEPLELALAHKNFCEWVWIDCFDCLPPDLNALQVLNENFKTCLVSPELQGGHEQDVLKFSQIFKHQINGVCTKFPELWER